jgi:hypothetical protein
MAGAPRVPAWNKHNPKTMLTLAIILTIVCGFLWMSRISPRFSLCERIGFAFPVGLAGITFLMLLADWAGVALTRGCLMGITVALTLTGAALLVPQRKAFVESLRPKVDLSGFNVLWLVLIIMVCYAEYANLSKCLFFPTYDRDSMAGFDTIGFLTAQEHTYRGLSIFQGDYMPLIHRSASVITYMPMLQLSYAYVYTLGAETSKLIPALFYLSFLIGFYGLVRRASNDTAAAAALLGVIMTPEMTAFSSLSGTNVVQAAMASTGLMYMCLWFSRRKTPLLVLGALLISINCWLRTEGAVFAGAAGLLVLVACLSDAFKRGESGAASTARKFLPLIAPVLALLPFVAFRIYSSHFGLTAANAVIAHLYWDGAKAQTIWNGAWALLTNSGYYGWAFTGFLLAIIANGYFMVKHRDSIHVALTIVVAIFLYFLALYHVDYVWDSIENVLNYSAKRYMFCFVPMAWYYICTCEAGRRLFGFVESACGFRK